MAKDLPISDGEYSIKGIGGEKAQKELRKQRQKLPKIKKPKKGTNNASHCQSLE